MLTAVIGATSSGGLSAELPAELVVNVRAGGQDREVLLHKYSIRAQGFRIRTWHQGRAGYVTQAPPEITTYRGTVTGEPNTRVCAVIKPRTGLTIYAHAGKTPIWSVTNEDIDDGLLTDPAESPVPDDEMPLDGLADGAMSLLDSSPGCGPALGPDASSGADTASTDGAGHRKRASDNEVLG